MSAIKIRDIYFSYGISAGTSATAVVDLSQASDARHITIIERCDFDGTATSNTGFAALNMNKNQGSILIEVNCWVTNSGTGGPVGLEWQTPGGGVKVIGGTYAGMNLHAQAISLYSVTVNSQIIVSGGAQTAMCLFDCYKNPSDDTPVVNNTSGNTVYLTVIGGRYYVQNNPSPLVVPVFFDSSAAGSNYNLSLQEVAFYGSSSSANPNPLLNTSFSSQLTIAIGLIFQNDAVLNIGQSTTGLGTPSILGLDSRSGLAAVDGSAVTLATAPAYNAVMRISAVILESAVTTPGGTITYTVTWTDWASNTRSVSATGTAALNATFQASALALVKSGTTVTRKLTSIGTGTGIAIDVAGVVEELQ
ncbi:MAG: hypothetical protein L3K16_08290 [Thermoplasmata archaeon]|nr:hypothetical protein [Thermoplasmata archaeon]